MSHLMPDRTFNRKCITICMSDRSIECLIRCLAGLAGADGSFSQAAQALKTSSRIQEMCLNAHSMHTQLVNGGGSGCTVDQKCTQCHGDCDSDADCEAGLTCFQRSSSLQTVPGCATGGSGDVSWMDYCYSPTTEIESISATITGSPTLNDVCAQWNQCLKNAGKDGEIKAMLGAFNAEGANLPAEFSGVVQQVMDLQVGTGSAGTSQLHVHADGWLRTADVLMCRRRAWMPESCNPRPRSARVAFLSKKLHVAGALLFAPSGPPVHMHNSVANAGAPTQLSTTASRSRT